MFLHKYCIWKKSCYWYIGQNALNQSDSMIFKWTICPEQIGETTSFLACWYKLAKIKSWLKSFWLVMNKNWYGQSVLWTLKNLPYLKNELMELTDLFAWYKLMQVERWLKSLGVGMVKIGYGLSCNGTLKLTVSEVWIDGINWFFCMLIHIHKN